MIIEENVDSWLEEVLDISKQVTKVDYEKTSWPTATYFIPTLDLLEVMLYFHKSISDNVW